MTKASKVDLFERMPIPKAVASLCIPTVISSLVMIIYNLADTFFVGLLNDSVQNNGVTLAAPVLLAFNAITNLFGVGTSSKMSRALGVKDYETVYKASSFGFYCTIILGVLFGLLCAVLKTPLLNLLGADATTWDATAGYLFWTTTLGTLPAVLNVTISYFVRAEGASLHASIGTMSGCILNIILDPIFILPWGLNMGAAGAGCATFIANVVACLYFAVFLIVKRGKTFVCVSPKKFRFEKHIAKDIFVVGIPASIQNLLNVTGMTILNNFTASFGNVDATAAMGIAHKVAMVPMYVSNGLSQGIMPLISYNFASGNVKRMKSTLKFTVCISLVIIVVISLAMFIFSAPITKLFLNDPDVIGFGRDFLRGYSLSLPFLCFDFVGVAVFQACGMGGKSLVFAILRKIILEIPALIVLNKIFPLVGLSYAQFVAEFILAFAALFVLIKMFKKLEKDSPKFSE